MSKRTPAHRPAQQRRLRLVILTHAQTGIAELIVREELMPGFFEAQNRAWRVKLEHLGRWSGCSWTHAIRAARDAVCQCSVCVAERARDKQHVQCKLVLDHSDCQKRGQKQSGRCTGILESAFAGPTHSGPSRRQGMTGRLLCTT